MSQTWDAIACRNLFYAVVQQTAEDLQHLREFDEAPKPSRYDQRRVDEILYYSPEAFIESDWFDQVCGYIDKDAGVLRRGLESAA